MRVQLALLTIVLSVQPFAQAAPRQREPNCKVAEIAKENLGSIQIRRVQITCPSDNATAVELARSDTTAKMPGILFSHSTIVLDETRSDLEPIAVDMARSGAAVVLIEGELRWPVSLGLTVTRDQHLLGAAVSDLLAHFNISSDRFALVGAMLYEPFRNTSIHNYVWVPLNGPNNSLWEINTAAGRKRAELWLHEQFGMHD